VRVRRTPPSPAPAHYSILHGPDAPCAPGHGLSIWGVPTGNSLAPVGGLCPEGTFENSPAFQRWVLRLSKLQVPKGRPKAGLIPMSVQDETKARRILGLWRGAPRAHIRQKSVTEAQRSQAPRPTARPPETFSKHALSAKAFREFPCPSRRSLSRRDIRE